MRAIALYIFFALTVPSSAFALLMISPTVTNPEIRQINGPHIVRKPDTVANGMLFITLGGTNSSADELTDLQELAASQGYHVLGIDYPNHVMTTICRQAADHNCFNNFRSEIMLGAPVSKETEVNFANCILNRIESLVRYLSHNDPEGYWGQFLTAEGDVNFEKIVVAGHSQGSGHAAYLAKLFHVKRAILFAGPQDVSSYGPASWLLHGGKTPPENFIALLHEKDPFGSQWQTEAVRDLIGNPKAEVVLIDSEIPQSSTAQIFVSKANVVNPHSAIVTKTFRKAWSFLLRLAKTKS